MLSEARRHLSRPWAWLALTSAVGFLLLAALVGDGGPLAIDPPLIAFVNRLPVPIEVWNLLTSAGGIVLLPIGVVVVIALSAVHRPRSAVIYGSAMIGASILTQWVKVAIARARPPGSALVPAPGFSFPSGQTLNSTVTYCLIALLIWRTSWPVWVRRACAIALASLVFAIGLSRIALGVHYPSDVLGGWLGGIAILAIVATMTDPDPDRSAARSV